MLVLILNKSLSAVERNMEDLHCGGSQLGEHNREAGAECTINYHVWPGQARPISTSRLFAGDT